MFNTGRTRAFTHNSPTTYKRITPDRGCGFILKRPAEHETEHPHAAHLTKEDVYLGTSWYHRPGFASQLWSWLLEDGLIESDDGMEEYNAPKSPFSSRQLRYARAYGHYEFGRGWTVRYGLTDRGRRIYKEMTERISKKASGPRPEEWREDDFLEPGETKDEWMARHGVTPMKAPPTTVERDILEKEAVHCAKLAVDYAGENQKLRTEKTNMNERLKNVYHRLGVLEAEMHGLQDEINGLVDWER